MDYYRLVFDKLLAAGTPDNNQREQIYNDCRLEVKAKTPLNKLEEELKKLEKVIVRQEMQALYEEIHQNKS